MNNKFELLKIRCVATIAAIFGICHLAVADVPEAKSTVNAKYVNPSLTRILQPDEKVGSLFKRNMEQDYVLQRLSKRTYWVQKNYYSTLFYVGDHGVLLFDAIGGAGESIKKAIASVTQLPISTIVYSHNHADHIGDIQVFTKENPQMRIIASKATFSQQKKLNSKFPAATEVVDWPNGQTTFEGLTIKSFGFDEAAHAEDHAIWLLVEEKIAHLPDLINPDQPPFWAFAGSESYLYYEANIDKFATLDWTIFNGGHGNVGDRKDIEFYLLFLADLKKEVGAAMGQVPWGTGVDASKINAHTVFLPAWLNAVSKTTVEALRPKYGDYYGFEAATLKNAEMVALALFDYQ